jgi:DNA-binding Xre family transcriptional regulator
MRLLGLPDSDVAHRAGQHRGQRRENHAGKCPVKRKVDYHWRLREVMAAHGMYATTDLVPLLRERGIDLSSSQVHRMVTGKPERLSLAVLAALCDIFETDPAELIAISAENLGVRRTADGDLPAPAVIAELRPKRARITDR